MSSQEFKIASRECGDCPIRHRAVCARCETDELQTLEEIKYYRSFAAGQTMVWAGDRMDFVASVVQGVATLSQTMEDGRTQMVGLLLPSDFIGRPGREIAPYNVTAVSDVTVCCFRRQPFEVPANGWLSRHAWAPSPAPVRESVRLEPIEALRDAVSVLGRDQAVAEIGQAGGSGAAGPRAGFTCAGMRRIMGMHRSGSR